MREGGSTVPKSANQKLRILFLRDFLLSQSDEEHPVTLKQMTEALREKGIEANRKTLYDDLVCLSDLYGMDIIRSGKSGRDYFVGSRDFSTEEIRLLVDMVQSSNFITLKKTDELIRKLEKMTSIHQGNLLSRNVYVRNRVKSMNESVYRNVDRISDAIRHDSVLVFCYFRYTMQKKKELRNNGKQHIVSPFALIWTDQNYYLLGYNHEAEEMRHFRVDRMTRIEITKGPRKGKELFDATDMSLYTTKVFSMFTGEETKVTMRFARNLTDSVIDRFGESVLLIQEDEEHFRVTPDIVVSPQFFAWLSAFGPDAEILAPENVREAMAAHLKSITAIYEKQAD